MKKKVCQKIGKPGSESFNCEHLTFVLHKKLSFFSQYEFARVKQNDRGEGPVLFKVDIFHNCLVLSTMPQGPDIRRG